MISILDMETNCLSCHCLFVTVDIEGCQSDNLECLQIWSISQYDEPFIPVKLPWIFPGAPLKINGFLEITGLLDRYAFYIYLICSAEMMAAL